MSFKKGLFGKSKSFIGKLSTYSILSGENFLFISVISKIIGKPFFNV
jgi:hypothetical protein